MRLRILGVRFEDGPDADRVAVREVSRLGSCPRSVSSAVTRARFPLRRELARPALVRSNRQEGLDVRYQLKRYRFG